MGRIHELEDCTYCIDDMRWCRLLGDCQDEQLLCVRGHSRAASAAVAPGVAIAATTDSTAKTSSSAEKAATPTFSTWSAARTIATSAEPASAEPTPAEPTPAEPAGTPSDATKLQQKSTAESTSANATAAAPTLASLATKCTRAFVAPARRIPAAT